MDVNGDELLAGPSLSCDAREFAVAVERGDRQEAARLYRGPFLHAVHLVDTRPWESWVDGQRLHFTRAHRLNCRDWVEERLRGDDLAGALEAASSWVAPDPSEDEAQHRLDPIRTTRQYADEIGRILLEVQGTTARYTFRGDEIYVRATVISSKPKQDPTSPEVLGMERAWTQPFLMEN